MGVMNNTLADNLRPSDQSLADCVAVHADGDRHSAKEMRDWTLKNCSSLYWWEHNDMSDINSWLGPDDCVSFYFLLPSDATAFRLKWL